MMLKRGSRNSCFSAALSLLCVLPVIYGLKQIAQNGRGLTWTDTPEGEVAHVRIQSPGAKALRLGFLSSSNGASTTCSTDGDSRTASTTSARPPVFTSG